MNKKSKFIIGLVAFYLFGSSSYSKELIGALCSDIRQIRKVEGYKTKKVLYKFPKNSILNKYFPDGLDGERMNEFGLWKKLTCGTELYKNESTKEIKDIKDVKILSNEKLYNLAIKNGNEGVYFELMRRCYGLKWLKVLGVKLKREILNGGFGPKAKRIYDKIVDEEKKYNTRFEEAEDWREKFLKFIEEKNLIKEYLNVVNYSAPYQLNYEQYSKIKRLIENNEQSYKIKKLAGLEKILENMDFLEEVSSYYGLEKSRVIEVMQQESSFQIFAVGHLEERGLGQFKKSTAYNLARLIANKKSKIYYPNFSLEDYSFENLSKDYKLNILLISAQIKIAKDIFERKLKSIGIDKEELLKIVRRKGMKTKFLKLSEEKTEPFDKYTISWKRALEVNRFWRDATISPEDLFYLVYNGGGNAIKNIMKDTPLAELLLYNLTVFLENKEKLCEYAIYHWGSLENMVKENSEFKNLDEDETLDFFGYYIYKVPMKKLRNYYNNGLVKIRIENYLNEKEIILILNSKESYLLGKNVVEIDNKTKNFFIGLKEIDKLYKKLSLLRKLESAQTKLNRAYRSRDKEDYKKALEEVLKLEKELKRKHTGIKEIKKDINDLEIYIENLGFVAR